MPAKSSTKAKPVDAAQLKFRISDELRAKLEEAAERSGRTIQSEITRRLETSFQFMPVEGQEPDVLKELNRKVEALSTTISSSLTQFDERLRDLAAPLAPPSTRRKSE